MCFNRAMSADIQFTTAELRTAAGQAIGMADQVGLARAASAAALPANAFGLICSPLFLPAYQLVQTAADAMMGSAAAGISRAAKGLSGTADAFDALETANVAAMNGVQQSL